MIAAPRLERDAVLAALRAADVLAHFQVAGARRGSEFRTRLCPACGPRSRDSVVINLESGKWCDKAHGCSGDVFDLVAQLGGLDARKDFPRVLELGAQIAGVGPDMAPEVVRRMLEQRRQQEALAAATRDRKQAAAMRRAAVMWEQGTRTHSADGERYLEQRGLNPISLIAVRAVRFHYDDPVVALHSSTGEVINVVRRRRHPQPDQSKVSGLKDAPSAGTLIGHLGLIAAGGLVVLTEGVADSLAAVLAWRRERALVLGAHGVELLPLIARYAAPRIARAGGGLVIVPHRDPPSNVHPAGAGQALGARAADLARTAGIEPTVIDLTPHKDLAEAWSKGWKP